MMNPTGIMALGNSGLAEKTQDNSPMQSLSAMKENGADFSSLLAAFSMNESSDEAAGEMVLNLINSNTEGMKPLMTLLESGGMSLEDVLTDSASLKNSEEILEELIPLFNQDVSADFASGDYEKLLGQLNDLFADMSVEMPVLDNNALTDTDAEQVLETLPSDWRKELIAMFDDEVSFSELTDDLAESGDPLALMAMLIQTNDDGGFSEVMKGEDKAALIQTLEQFASKMFGLKETESRSENRTVLNEIRSLFQASRQNTDRQNNDKSFNNGNIRESEQSAATRYAELAYLKQAVQKTAQSNHASQGSSLMLESTNSQLARFQHFMSSTGETQPQQTERTSQDQLMRQFQNLLSRSSFQQMNNGLQQLTIKLHPESLGRLDVQLQQVNGLMTAKLMTSTQSARELLDGQVQSLRNAFQAQNIQVDKIEITQQQTSQLLKDQEQSSAEKQTSENDHDSDEQEEEETLDFSEFLEETLDDEAFMDEEI